jgi:DNA-binding response OmpR family regulator
MGENRMATVSAERTYSCGDVEIDTIERLVRVRGRAIAPTFGEFEILLCLVREPRRVFTRTELHDTLANRKSSGLRAVDVHIARLRSKLAAARQFNIEAVQHVGYRCSDRRINTR